MKRKTKIKPQTVQDFMDDEDANDWGGPVSVRKDYHDQFPERQSGEMNSSRNIQSADALKQILSGDVHIETKTSLSIGKQLLRVLGWREIETGNLNNNGDDDGGGTCYIYVAEEDGDVQSLLPHTRNKIKRIERKLSKHKKALPNPKTDTYGLGYDAFRNAPEFQAHKDSRNRRAYAKARAASSSHGDLKQNVYRTSALRGLFQDGEEDDHDGFGMVTGRFGDGFDRKGRKINPCCTDVNSATCGDILAYETTEDFIGQKTVGGFALHDDDDDVYDDDDDHHRVDKVSRGRKTVIDTEEYENEIVEAGDSDLDTDGNEPQHESEMKRQHLSKDNIASFAGALSSWASGTEQVANVSSIGTKTTTSMAVTSDGRQPLKGFALGSSSIGQQTMKRFPGPDVPFNFVATRHVFQMAHSEMLKQLSSYTRRNKISNECYGSKHEDEIKCSHVRADIQRDLKPLAGNAFPALSESLKDRFRKTSDDNKGIGEKKPSHASPADPTKVTIIRKQQVWQPSPLLCKRMEVAVPRVSSYRPLNHEHRDKKERSTEDSFFQAEIFGKISKGTLTKENFDDTDYERPTMEIMKSIFEPLSNDNDDDDMSISDDDGDDNHDCQDTVNDVENDKPQECSYESQYLSSGPASEATSHNQGASRPKQSSLSPVMISQINKTSILSHFCVKDHDSERIISKEKNSQDERQVSLKDDSLSSVSECKRSKRERKRSTRKHSKQYRER
jgi:hypothetical protein